MKKVQWWKNRGEMVDNIEIKIFNIKIIVIKKDLIIVKENILKNIAVIQID